jgi:S1-C subfamily serine protease
MQPPNLPTAAAQHLPTLPMPLAPAPVAHPARGDLLDLILLALCAAYAYAGYRRGLLSGAFSLGGFVLGAWLGTVIGPAVAAAIIGQHGQRALGQRVLALAIVFLVAVLGENVGALLGTRVRRLFTPAPARWADATGGALLDVVGVLFIAWVLAYVLASAPFPTVVKQIRRSAILNAVDSVMPTNVGHLFAALNRLLQAHDLPNFTDPFASLPIPPAALPPPNAGVVPPALRAAGPDVVKITGVAQSCSRELEGSGFVYAPDHVLTNAHVLAGVTHPQVALPSPGGRVLAATVVLYDPNRDVAVLDVPGLGRPPLRFTGNAATGADAVVAGYPENGPLTAVAARVAGDQSVTGPNIYDDRQVTRDVYTLRARVRPGNSGGPLLSPSGAVYGVVFAASVDQPDVGYALTASEVMSDADAGAVATRPVSTDGCD